MQELSAPSELLVHAPVTTVASRHTTLFEVGLKRFDILAEQLDPDFLKSILDSFSQQVEQCLAEYGGSVLFTAPGRATAIFGLAGKSVHHALRATMCACSLTSRWSAICDTLPGPDQGSCDVPDCDVCLHTGDPLFFQTEHLLHMAGCATLIARHYLTLGRGGTVVMSEACLHSVLEVLPSGWKMQRVRDPITVSSTDLIAEGLLPLEEELRGICISVGPELDKAPDKFVLRFRYLHETVVKGLSQHQPMIFVSTPYDDFLDMELSGGRKARVAKYETFGKYRLVKVLGRGGMSEVWLARDRFGNPVAVKKLLPELGLSPIQIKRLKREAAIMGKLSHRNICRIIEVGDAEGITYIAMEYIDGVPLSSVLSLRNKSLPTDTAELEEFAIPALVEKTMTYVEDLDPDNDPFIPQGTIKVEYRILPHDRTLWIIRRVCEAMEHAHANGVLHRDLKPSNIMLRADGEPVVMDFGLAKMQSESFDVSLSLSGQIMGTVDYMAPEQAVSSKHVSEQADIYSIGCILYQMLTGRRHFHSSNNLGDDIQRLQHHDPIRPRSLNTHLSLPMEIVVLKALRPETAERYKTLSVLRSDLESLSTGSPVTARPITSLAMLKRLVRRNQATSIAIATGLVTICAGFLFFSVSYQHERVIAEQHRRMAEEKAKEAEQAKIERDTAQQQAATQKGELERALDFAKRRDSEARDARRIAEEKEKVAREVSARLDQASNDDIEARKKLLKDQELAKRQVAEAAKTAAEASLQVARQHLQLGDLDDAYRHVSKALYHNPTLADALQLKIRLHLAAFDTASAADTLKSLSKNPFTPSKPDAVLNGLVPKYHAVVRRLSQPWQDRDLQLALASDLQRSASPDNARIAEALRFGNPQLLAEALKKLDAQKP